METKTVLNETLSCTSSVKYPTFELVARLVNGIPQRIVLRLSMTPSHTEKTITLWRRNDTPTSPTLPEMAARCASVAAMFVEMAGELSQRS